MTGTEVKEYITLGLITVFIVWVFLGNSINRIYQKYICGKKE